MLNRSVINYYQPEWEVMQFARELGDSKPIVMRMYLALGVE